MRNSQVFEDKNEKNSSISRLSKAFDYKSVTPANVKQMHFSVTKRESSVEKGEATMLYRPSHGRISATGSTVVIDREGNSVERSVSNLSGVANAPRVSSLMKPTAASSLKARQPVKANHEVKKDLQTPTPMQMIATSKSTATFASGNMMLIEDEGPSQKNEDDLKEIS